METLIDLLNDGQESHGDRPALSIRAGLREEVWSYRRLGTGAAAIASYLRHNIRIPAGGRIIVWGPNCPRLVAAYFGVMLARLVLVPIDPLSPIDFVRRVAAKTRAAAVVTGFGPVSIESVRVVSLDDLPFGGPAAPMEDLPEPDDVAEIVFTSGTTGTPKGVLLTHRNIVANVRSAGRLVPNRRYRLLSILPLSHMLEQTVGLYVPLLLGSEVHYTLSRHPRVLARALRSHRTTTIVLVPQVLEVMYQGIENEVAAQHRERSWQMAHRLAASLPMRARRVVFHNVLRHLGGKLDFVICGGARLAPDLMAKWERLGVRVIAGYGATECAPLIAGNSYHVRIPDVVGAPAPDVEVKISAQGEVLVRGPNVTPGYWEDDDATAAAFDDNGWYRTGDLGTLDREGHLRLTGRLRDLIVLPNGLNVHPEDVEEELAREPAVADCVVVAKPDKSGRATVHAVVIPASGQGSSESIIGEAVRAASQRLAPHQHVAGFTLWDRDDFPRTNLRKVKRHEVQAAVERAAPPTESGPAAGATVLDEIRGLLAEASGRSVADIMPDTDVDHELELDSLARVELAIAIERKLGIPVEEDELGAVGTVADLVEIVERSDSEPTPPRYPGWPRRPAWTAIRQGLQKVLLFPIHALVARPLTIEGRANLAAVTPPLLLVANHSSHLDTPSVVRALPSGIRRRIAVAAAADYFYSGRLRGAAMSLLLGAFPFSREGAVRPSLEHCGTLVDAGWSVLIYPEGTRSVTGSIGPFRTGIGLLARQLGVPVIPVGLVGTHAALPKGATIPHRRPITVRFGPALIPDPGVDRLEIVATLERAVSSLLGEDKASRVRSPPA
ncbi:MAG: AMP-binding protein [Acidimicrobiia bacterium]|nr:AMP-binding protein [Acidimicrobiia bacterium]